MGKSNGASNTPKEERLSFRTSKSNADQLRQVAEQEQRDLSNVLHVITDDWLTGKETIEPPTKKAQGI